jgi:hypothetical protein
VRDLRRIPDLTGRSDRPPSKEGIKKPKSLAAFRAGTVKFPLLVRFSALKGRQLIAEQIRDPSYEGYESLP